MPMSQLGGNCNHMYMQQLATVGGGHDIDSGSAEDLLVYIMSGWCKHQEFNRVGSLQKVLLHLRDCWGIADSFRQAVSDRHVFCWYVRSAMTSF